MNDEIVTIERLKALDPKIIESLEEILHDSLRARDIRTKDLHGDELRALLRNLVENYVSIDTKGRVFLQDRVPNEPYMWDGTSWSDDYENEEE